MPDSSPQVRIFWSDQEFRSLAAGIIARFPHRPYHEARTQDDLRSLTLAEFRQIQESVLPPDRWRPLKQIKEFLLTPLLVAIARLRGDAQLPDSRRPAYNDKHHLVSTAVQWDDLEWEQLATLLDAHYPDLHLIDSPDLVELTLRQVNGAAAMMARPRQVAALVTIRPRLLAAFDRIKRGPHRVIPAVSPPPPPPPPPAGSRIGQLHIVWDDDEWEQMARALDQAYPHAKFADSPDLGTLTIRQLNAVAATVARPRDFRQAVGARPRLLAAYARLRANRVPRRAPAPAEPASPLNAVLDGNRLKPISEAVRAAALARYAAPSAASLALADAREILAQQPAPHRTIPHTPPHDTDAAPGKPERAPAPVTAPPAVFGKIHWTRDEWLSLAIELHKMFPLKNYPARDDVNGLNSQDVAFAQLKALPFSRHRRHLKVVSFTQLRPNLLSAFKDLRHRIMTSDLAAERERQIEAEATAAVAAEDATPFPPRTSAAPALAQVAAAPGAAADPWAAAAAPLMALLSRTVANLVLADLRPQLDRIEAALTALPAAVPAPTPVPVLASAALELAPAPERRAEQPDDTPPPRFKVGILGNRNSYKDELAKEFPGVDFTCIDTSKKLAEIANADKVVCLIRFVSHKDYHKCKKAAGERFVQIDTGGVTELKRLITAWLHGIPLTHGRHLMRHHPAH